MNQEHPVKPHVRDAICVRLSEIEVKHGVRVLYACESGSRAWGFASPDSDYDVRFIYVQPLSWYLQLGYPRDVIEEPFKDDLDINGWELRKALGLIRRGNVTPLEWLQSPVVYRADTDFLAKLTAAARLTHQAERSFHHYINMAWGNFREYLRGDRVRLKKYLYVLRPLLAAIWVEQQRGIAPVRFQDLVDAIVVEPDVRLAIDRLLAIKRSVTEAEYGQPMPVLNAYINHHLMRLQMVEPPEPRDVEYSVLDQMLQGTVLGQP